tara:strand:- start:31753 stop:33102 length:1350 start_codon:yes stop_codon:yes gene_type:complete
MGEIYTKVVSRLIFPMHEMLKQHRTLRWKKYLEKSQWESALTIQSRQNSDLTKLLQDAYKHSPFYRALFNEYKINPDGVRSINDIAQFPLLTKDIIKRNRGIIKYSHAGKLRQYQTGGSSGEPLQFYVSKTRVAHDVAAKWRATQWWGVDIGDRELVIWGSGIECGKQSYIRKIRDYIFRTDLVPAKDLDNNKINKIIKKIKTFKPKMIFGYPSILCYVAAYAKQTDQVCDDLGIKVAFVTSEVLDENQKDIIESTFGCPVANGYGGRDAGFIAHQCPKGNMHITAEDIVVEILDEQGQAVKPGESGEIVVTHLRSYGFPFIRYRTGDIGSIDMTPCACKRGLPILKNLIGRSSDLIYTHNGAVVHRAEIVRPITSCQGIERFQFIQKSKEHALLKVQGHELKPDETQNLQSAFRELLGPNTQLDIIYVKNIQPEMSGKFKFVISEVSQ